METVGTLGLDYIEPAVFWTPVSQTQFKAGGDNAWVHFNMAGQVYSHSI